MDNKKVLTYKNMSLTASDLDILRGPCYLNDQIIGFYFTYLSSMYTSTDILLVPPSISFWIANSPEESLNDFVEPLKLSSKRLVLFTVNDNDDVGGGECGTHWSLLVYDRSTHVFSHHDTMEGVNNSYAVKLYEAVKGFIGTAAEPLPATSSKAKSKKKKDLKSSTKSMGAAKCDSWAAVAIPPIFVENNTLQQTNGYDCGLYVIAIAKVICQWYACERIGKYGDWMSAVERSVDVSVEMTMRDEVLRLVEELQKA